MSAPSFSPTINRDFLIRVYSPDPSWCEWLAITFRMEGFQCEVALTRGQFNDQNHYLPAHIAYLELDEDGLRLLGSLRAQLVPPPVIMFSDGDHPDLIVRAMKEGASDVLIKPLDTVTVLRSVTEARRRIVLGRVTSGPRVSIGSFAALTPRERQVLQLITQGRSNKEASQALSISHRTVEVHRARIMEKLGAKNTAELVRIALTG